jgi:hypothetical protein
MAMAVLWCGSVQLSQLTQVELKSPDTHTHTHSDKGRKVKHTTVGSPDLVLRLSSSTLQLNKQPALELRQGYLLPTRTGKCRHAQQQEQQEQL